MKVKSRVQLMERDVHTYQQQVSAEECRVNSLVAEKQRIEQAR